MMDFVQLVLVTLIVVAVGALLFLLAALFRSYIAYRCTLSLSFSRQPHLPPV